MKYSTIQRTATLSTLLAGSLVTSASANDPIQIGVLEDQSGNFAAVTQAKVNAIELAAEEINEDHRAAKLGTPVLTQKNE